MAETLPNEPEPAESRSEISSTEPSRERSTPNARPLGFVERIQALRTALSIQTNGKRVWRTNAIAAVRRAQDVERRLATLAEIPEVEEAAAKGLAVRAKVDWEEATNGTRELWRRAARAILRPIPETIEEQRLRQSGVPPLPANGEIRDENGTLRVKLGAWPQPVPCNRPECSLPAGHSGACDLASYTARQPVPGVYSEEQGK